MKQDNLENLYDYVLHYNPYKKLWYAIPRTQYTSFFADSSNDEGVIKASTVDALINSITK